VGWHAHYQNGIYWLKEKDDGKKPKQRGLRRAGVKGIQPAEVIQFWSAIILIILLLIVAD